MKQSEIAQKAECTQGFISRLLAGVAKPHSRELAVRISKAFGVHPDWWDEPDTGASQESKRAG